MKSSKSSEESRRIDAAADIDAFESHLKQLYLYYKARRRRGQGVLLISSAWACYNASVWFRGWLESGIFSWFLLVNTVGSVMLASVCAQSTYRDSQIYVPDRYELRTNGTLEVLGLTFDERKNRGEALQRHVAPPAKSSGDTGARIDSEGRSGGRRRR